MSVAQIFACPFAKPGTICERGQNNPLASRLVLQNHLRSVHNAQRWTCPVLGCKKAQRDFANYRRHLKIAHCRGVQGEVLPDNMRIAMCIGCEKHDFRSDNIKRHSENCGEALNHRRKHGGQLVVMTNLGARRQAGLWTEKEAVLIPGAVAAALAVAAERIDLLPVVAPVAAAAAPHPAAATASLPPPLPALENEDPSFSLTFEDQTPFEPLPYIDYGDTSLFDVLGDLPLPELPEDYAPLLSGFIDPTLLMDEPLSSPFVPSFPDLVTDEESIDQDPILALISAFPPEQIDHNVTPVFTQWEPEYAL